MAHVKRFPLNEKLARSAILGMAAAAAVACGSDADVAADANESVGADGIGRYELTRVDGAAPPAGLPTDFAALGLTEPGSVIDIFPAELTGGVLVVEPGRLEATTYVRLHGGGNDALGGNSQATVAGGTVTIPPQVSFNCPESESPGPAFVLGIASWPVADDSPEPAVWALYVTGGSYTGDAMELAAVLNYQRLPRSSCELFAGVRHRYTLRYEPAP